MLALQLECEVIGQVTALVIPAEQKERIRIPDLESPEVEYAFDGEVSSVDVISEEEVSRLGRVATNFKQLH
jgi:hypothetical protein